MSARDVTADGRVRVSRSAQLSVGAGCLAFGLASAVGPWMLLRSSRTEHALANAQQTWTSATCEITSARRVRTSTDEDHEDGVRVGYSLEVGGATYDGTYTYMARIDEQAHAVGRRVACDYDPADPRRSTLVRMSAPAGSEPRAGLFEVAGTLVGIPLLFYGAHLLMRRRPLYTRPGELRD